MSSAGEFQTRMIWVQVLGVLDCLDVS